MFRSRAFFALLLICLVQPVFCSVPAFSLTEDYGFDLDEFEKKSFSWGGYAEVNLSHQWFNRDAAFTLLDADSSARSDLDRLSSVLQLEGNYHKESLAINWRLQGSSQVDQLESENHLTVLSAYAGFKPTQTLSLELGKMVFKWGKGYAWNPVAFIDRAKDPNNPEEVLEGYFGTAFDWIRSYPSHLQTLALTGVFLPVWDGVNDDFAETTGLNFAARLYLLYRDTDIDFSVYAGDSRSTRYGFDFSRNLASNFEIHGEVAYLTEQGSRIMNSIGQIENRQRNTSSYLLGIRYLSQSETTTVLEYYHHGGGYSETEMDQFYQLAHHAYDQFQASGNDTLLQKVGSVSKDFSKPQIGKNYLYLRVTQKEPFDILYFTPGISAILNLDDHSCSVTPEAVYSGFTNWEVRLRYTHLVGDRFTEYGEKLNEAKAELRIRFFF